MDNQLGQVGLGSVAPAAASTYMERPLDDFSYSAWLAGDQAEMMGLRTPRDRGAAAEFSKGMKIGLMGAYSGILSTVGDEANAKRWKDYIQSRGDLRRGSDSVTSASYLSYMAGTGLATAVPLVGAGVVGGIIGGALGGPIGAAATIGTIGGGIIGNTLLSLGDNMDDLLSNTKASPMAAFAGAVTSTIAQGAVEFAFGAEARMASVLARGLGIKAATEAGTHWAGRLWSGFGRHPVRMLSTAGQEAVEEAIQLGIQDITRMSLGGLPSSGRDYVDNMMGGLTAGFLLGGLTTFIDRYTDEATRKQVGRTPSNEAMEKAFGKQAASAAPGEWNPSYAKFIEARNSLRDALAVHMKPEEAEVLAAFAANASINMAYYETKSKGKVVDPAAFFNTLQIAVVDSARMGKVNLDMLKPGVQSAALVNHLMETVDGFSSMVSSVQYGRASKLQKAVNDGMDREWVEKHQGYDQRHQDHKDFNSQAAQVVEEANSEPVFVGISEAIRRFGRKTVEAIYARPFRFQHNKMAFMASKVNGGILISLDTSAEVMPAVVEGMAEGQILVSDDAKNYMIEKRRTDEIESAFDSADNAAVAVDDAIAVEAKRGVFVGALVAAKAEGQKKLDQWKAESDAKLAAADKAAAEAEAAAKKAEEEAAAAEEARKKAAEAAEKKARKESEEKAKAERKAEREAKKLAKEKAAAAQAQREEASRISAEKRRAEVAARAAAMQQELNELLKNWAGQKKTLPEHLSNEALFMARKRRADKAKQGKKIDLPAALYTREAHLLIFFDEITFGKFYHEWLHHVTSRGLIPTWVSTILRRAFQPDGSDPLDAVTMENAAYGAMVWLMQNKLPTTNKISLEEMDELEKAMYFIAKHMALTCNVMFHIRGGGATTYSPAQLFDPKVDNKTALQSFLPPDFVEFMQRLTEKASNTKLDALFGSQEAGTASVIATAMAMTQGLSPQAAAGIEMDQRINEMMSEGGPAVAEAEEPSVEAAVEAVADKLGIPPEVAAPIVATHVEAAASADPVAVQKASESAKEMAVPELTAIIEPAPAQEAAPEAIPSAPAAPVDFAALIAEYKKLLNDDMPNAIQARARLVSAAADYKMKNGSFPAELAVETPGKLQTLLLEWIARDADEVIQRRLSDGSTLAMARSVDPKESKYNDMDEMKARRTIRSTGTLAMMGSVKARTANRGDALIAGILERAALELKPNMTTPEKEAMWKDIASKTGWHRVLEGEKWMFVIDTSKMAIIASETDIGDVRGIRGLLFDVVDIPGLREIYPELASIRVELRQGSNNSAGYQPEPFPGTIDGNYTALYRIKRTLAHEIQHAIQEIEGMQSGGNVFSETANLSPEERAIIQSRHMARLNDHGIKLSEALSLQRDDEYEMARRRYMRITGEVMARLSAKMMDMTQEQIEKEGPREILKRMLVEEGFMNVGEYPEDVVIYTGYTADEGGTLAMLNVRPKNVQPDSASVKLWPKISGLASVGKAFSGTYTGRSNGEEYKITVAEAKDSINRGVWAVAAQDESGKRIGYTVMRPYLTRDYVADRMSVPPPTLGVEDMRLSREQAEELELSIGDTVLVSDDTEVMGKHQRQGVASAMYAMAADVSEIPVVPSTMRTFEGESFWSGAEVVMPAAVTGSETLAMAAKREGYHVAVRTQDGKIHIGKKDDSHGRLEERLIDERVIPAEYIGPVQVPGGAYEEGFVDEASNFLTRTDIADKLGLVWGESNEVRAWEAAAGVRRVVPQEDAIYAIDETRLALDNRGAKLFSAADPAELIRMNGLGRDRATGARKDIARLLDEAVSAGVLSRSSVPDGLYRRAAHEKGYSVDDKAAFAAWIERKKSEIRSSGETLAMLSSDAGYQAWKKSDFGGMMDAVKHRGSMAAKAARERYMKRVYQAMLDLHIDPARVTPDDMLAINAHLGLLKEGKNTPAPLDTAAKREIVFDNLVTDGKNEDRYKSNWASMIQRSVRYLDTVLRRTIMGPVEIIVHMAKGGQYSPMAQALALPLQNAQSVRARFKETIEHKIMQFQDSLAPKHGARASWILSSTFDAAGVHMSMNRALDVYRKANGGEPLTITRADGTTEVIDPLNTKDILDLKASNPEFTDDVIKACIAAVKENPAMMATDEFIDSMYNWMFQDEIELTWEQNGELKTRVVPGLGKVFERVVGRPFERVQGKYSMRRRTGDYIGMDDLFAFISERAVEEGSPDHEFHTPLKTRIEEFMRRRTVREGTERRELTLDTWVNFMSWMQSAANFTAMAEAVREVEDVLRDRRIAQVIKDRFGHKSYGALMKTVRREMYATGKMEPSNAAERAIGLIQNNAAVSVLSGVTSAIAQTPGLFFGMAQFSPREMASAVAIAMKAMGYITAHIGKYGGIPLLRQVGKHPLSGMKEYQLMLSKSPALGGRAGMHHATYDVFIGAMESKFLRNVKNYAAHERYIASLMYLDSAIVVALWNSVYQNELDRLTINGMTPDVADKNAAMFAERVVENTQNPSSFSTKGLLQAGGKGTAWVNMIAPFHGATFSILRWYYLNMVKPVMETMAHGMEHGNMLTAALQVAGKAMKPKNARMMMMAVIIPGFLAWTLAHRRPPKDEKEWAMAAGMYPMLALPVIGQSMYMSILGGREMELFQPMPVQVLEGAAGLGAAGAKYAFSGGEDVPSENEWRKAARAVSIGFGVPQWMSRIFYTAAKNHADLSARISGGEVDTEAFNKYFLEQITGKARSR